MRIRKLGVVCAAALLWPAIATAQLRATTYATGLSSPLAFVQDPADAANQYVVQQGGVIRLIRNGVLQPTPFLDITGAILSGGERGLLGMAMPPDYATSGRFYVNFTAAGTGNTVIARFKRSAANPLVADPASRLDMLWSTGDRFIVQPFANHNGGTLQFGPDGFLYIGMGDGGSGNDPLNQAQDPTSLLGKMLRIDVSVGDGDAKGFRIPPGNPFAGTSRPEIWDFGMRNPFKFSFDDPAHGGTGALIIGDVGQGAWEEIDYEPAGRGGNNYGWRIREGAHDNVTSAPPAFLPLVDPIFEYTRTVGASITGGYVYRGTALGPQYRGRYFFADFVSQRIWSIALTIDPATGNATASDFRNHTAELVGGNISSFGVDASGELYFVDLVAGRVSRIGLAAPAVPSMVIDLPSNGQTVSQPFVIAGWAVDPLSTSGPGIDAIHVWAYPIDAVGGNVTGSPRFVNNTTLTVPRPDVAAAFGSDQFTNSGFGVGATRLPPGAHRLAVFAFVTRTGSFSLVRTVDVNVVARTLIFVDVPASGTTVTTPSFLVRGWALDAAAASGNGVDAIHVWAVPAQGGSFVFLGATTTFESRPDVGNFFGPGFGNSGYSVTATSPPNGAWDVFVYARSTVTGQFQVTGPVRITVNR